MIPTSERFDQLPPSGHRRGGKALTDGGVAAAPNGNYSAGLSSSAIGAERVRQHAGRRSFDRGLRELSTLTRLRRGGLHPYGRFCREARPDRLRGRGAWMKCDKASDRERWWRSGAKTLWIRLRCAFDCGLYIAPMSPASKEGHV